jgi:competence protein ComEC
VSGENVALLLAVASPLLRRCRLWPRLGVTLALLLFFAVVTRFEPSVLRAALMAAIAATGVALGRPASARRSLALAVAVLLVIDPFLVHSIGFALSVGASVGIIALARSLAGALPGPRTLARAVGVTLAAQVGVAPLLVGAFGGVPVATLPANVLAAPAAALVAIWGLPAGLVGAGLGSHLARLAVAPTGWLLAWVGGVARATAGLPLGRLGVAGAAALSAGVVAVALGHASPRVPVRRWSQRVGGLVLVVALVSPAVALRLSPPAGRLDGGIELRRGGGAVVLLVSSGASLSRALDALAAAGVRRLDVVVVPRGGPADGAFVAGLRHRCRVGRVLGPPGEQLRDGTAVVAGERWRVGGLLLVVEATTPHLRVSVSAVHWT